MPDLEPLDADVLSLLERAKPVEDLDAARKAAILGAVAARLGALPPTEGGGGGTPSGSGAASGPTNVLQATSPLALAGPIGVTGARVAVLAATFAIGVGTGVAVDRATLPRSPPITSAVVASEPAPLAVASGTNAESFGVPVSSLPSVPHDPAARTASRVEARSAAAPSARGLAAERALLDVARSALARGEATEAMTAVARHAHEYPDGALAEEREAIAIRALVALGRRDEARARAAAFEAKFPHSLNLRAVKGAVEGVP